MSIHLSPPPDSRHKASHSCHHTFPTVMDCECSNCKSEWTLPSSSRFYQVFSSQQTGKQLITLPGNSHCPVLATDTPAPPPLCISYGFHRTGVWGNTHGTPQGTGAHPVARRATLGTQFTSGREHSTPKELEGQITAFKAQVDKPDVVRNIKTPSPQPAG